jgi:hypothetical protein
MADDLLIEVAVLTTVPFHLIAAASFDRHTGT